jgi:hypothetical protein
VYEEWERSECPKGDPEDSLELGIKPTCRVYSGIYFFKAVFTGESKETEYLKEK